MTLDMSRVDLQRSETVTLLDTNRRWEVTLTNGGTPFRLPNNWTASLVGVKPDEDENGLMLSCSVVDGRIIFDFAENEQLTTCAGAFPLVFDVWNEYGELVASPKIWLHVLPDVRPREDLKSTGQYTTIGELIAAEKANREDIDKNASDIASLDERVDGIGEKVDDHEDSITRLFEITANNGSAIEDFISHTYPAERDEIKDRLTTGGTILVPKGDWGDSEQNVTVQIKLKGNVLKPGTLMVLAPGNDATKQIVAEYGMSMRVNETVDGSADGEDIVVLERKPGKIPEANLTFYYAVIVIGGNTTPIATLVGGLGGSGSGGEEFYVGEDEPPATATMWIDPSGDPTNTETWEFVMENGDTVTKELVVVDD
jgi:hypothetical protein